MRLFFWFNFSFFLFFVPYPILLKRISYCRQQKFWSSFCLCHIIQSPFMRQKGDLKIFSFVCKDVLLRYIYLERRKNILAFILLFFHTKNKLNSPYPFWGGSYVLAFFEDISIRNLFECVFNIVVHLHEPILVC